MALKPSFVPDLMEALRETAVTDILPRLNQLAPEEIRTKSHPGDLVTQADVAAEKRLSAAIRSLLPGTTVIGEESVADGQDLMSSIEGSGLTTIIDPIDGTLNFARGIPLFGTMVSIQRRGQTIFGCLYDPVLDDAIVAELGAGAWHWKSGTCGGRIECDTGNAPIRHAGHFNIMATPQSLRARALTALSDLSEEQPFTITSLSCSCHEYRQLGQGLASFIVSQHAKPWDHAAGVAILREAGGDAVFLDGSSYRPGHAGTGVVAATSSDAAKYYQDRFAFLAKGSHG